MRVISGLLTFLLYVAFTWGELGGIVHAFTHHGTGDGFAAVFVPPWAWYRSIEFFWHQDPPADTTAVPRGRADADTSASRTAAPRGGTDPATAYPAPNAEETDVLSRIGSKSAKQPLTQADLDAYKDALRSYGSRTGRPVNRRDLDEFLELSKLSSSYDREMGRCLLASIDQKRPFISTELETLQAKIKSSGLMREARLAADLRNIESAAYGSTLVDEFGHKHYPPTREDVLRRLKEDDIVAANLDKMAAAIEEVLGPRK